MSQRLLSVDLAEYEQIREAVAASHSTTLQLIHEAGSAKTDWNRIAKATRRAAEAGKEMSKAWSAFLRRLEAARFEAYWQHRNEQQRRDDFIVLCTKYLNVRGGVFERIYADLKNGEVAPETAHRISGEAAALSRNISPTVLQHLQVMMVALSLVPSATTGDPRQPLEELYCLLPWLVRLELLNELDPPEEQDAVG
jgi:hypothetical protein